MKRKLSPIISMVILIFIVALASFILSLVNFDSNQTSIIDGKLETSVVYVNNIFSKDGFTNFFKNIMNNFSLVQPVITLVLAMAGIGVLHASGFLKHVFLPLKKIKPSLITFLVILISVLASIVGEYSYIILLPLVGVMYKYINKSPILGVITVFIGVTLGYGTGIFYNFNDYALGLLTEYSATIDVATSYRFDLYSNIYIMIASCIIITFVISYLVEQNLSKKIVISETYSDDLIISKKAFISSLIIGLVFLSFIILLCTPLFGSIFLDDNESVVVAKFFSDDSPFNASFMFLFLILCSFIGGIYGFISKNFKSNLDFGWGYSKLFHNVGYLFILMFLSSILVYVIDWTNIGVVVANVLVNFLSVLEISGIALIIIAFALIILMSVLLPNSLEKWVIISPILIPIFVRANLTPDFAQFVFKAADSVGKIITPAFIFFPILIGFIQMHNVNKNKITLMGTVKLIMPIILSMVVFWLIILIIWYVAGLPLGLDSFTTL